MDVVQTTQDTSSKLTPKRVPNSVLDFFLLAISVGGGDADPLLAIDRFTGSHVSGDEQVFLALGDVDTFVLVGFKGDSTGTLPAETGLAATTTASTAGRTSTTGSTSSSTTGTTTGSTTTAPAAESTSTASTTSSTAPGAASTAATTASVTESHFELIELLGLGLGEGRRSGVFVRFLVESSGFGKEARNLEGRVVSVT